jgi:hypothetical protein
MKGEKAEIKGVEIFHVNPLRAELDALVGLITER